MSLRRKWVWFKWWFLEDFTVVWALLLTCLAAILALMGYVTGLGIWIALGSY